MARIRSYPYDTTVTDNDAWIGTDSATRNTKQFTAKAVAEYLNINGKISVSAQMVYKFNPDAANTGEFTGVADGTNFSSISSLTINNTDASGQNVLPFLTYLVNSEILISEQNSIDNFGHYNIDAFTTGTTTSVLSLSYKGGNGSLEKTKYYDFAAFSLAGDKTFVFTQGVPASTWNIVHNLGKFPSVSVVDTADSSVFGDVTYVNNNELTVAFSATFAGKAFLN